VPEMSDDAMFASWLSIGFLIYSDMIVVKANRVDLVCLLLQLNFSFEDN